MKDTSKTIDITGGESRQIIKESGLMESNVDLENIKPITPKVKNQTLLTKDIGKMINLMD